MTGFRWDDWNLDHVTKHGVTIEEVEAVIHNARRPYPRDLGNGRYLVWDRGSGGRLLQVIFIRDLDKTIYAIHARPLTSREKLQYRRIRRHEP